MEMGKKIRLLRVDRGLSQEKLAEMVGVTQTTISDTELGINRNVSFLTIAGIADALEVSIDWLRDDSQEYPPPERVEKKRERSRR